MIQTDADRELLAKPDTRKMRLFVAAQVATFQKQLAPFAMLLSLTDLDSAFADKAPLYFQADWKLLLAAVRELRADLDRWEQDEKDVV